MVALRANMLEVSIFLQSGKSGTVRESNQAYGERKTHYVYFFIILCTKKLLFVSRNWHKKNKFCSMWVQPYKNPFF